MSDKIKTLSQAIRLGATFRPQCHGSLFRTEFRTETGTSFSSCALGAAYEAVFGLPGDYIHPASEIERLMERFPELKDQYTFQPGLNLRRQIEVWNDTEKLTREQIADRVEKEEGNRP